MATKRPVSVDLNGLKRIMKDFLSNEMKPVSHDLAHLSTSIGSMNTTLKDVHTKLEEVSKSAEEANLRRLKQPVMSIGSIGYFN